MSQVFFDELAHLPGGGESPLQRALPCDLQFIVTPRPPAPLGYRVRKPRPDEALVLQPIERGVHGAERNPPWRRQLLDLLMNRHSIRVVTEREHRGQNHLLELAEGCGSFHMIYSVGLMRRSVKEFT